jgi:glycosyltransferase involved in cell wall biosynthesis
MTPNDAERFAVVIPTRERAAKLAKCLTALQRSRDLAPFSVHVCDSSRTEQTRAEVADVVDSFAFATLHRHEGTNVAMARNVCARVADEPLLVNVDDDIYVEPDAVHRLVAAYRAASGPRVVAGSVAWDEDWSTPNRLRWIGWGRPPREGEDPHFLIGAFFAYPRALPLALPWNERLKVSDDRFIGALWRAYGIALLWEPEARAFHDDQHVSYGVEAQWSHLYTNLFDAALANPNLPRALSYELLGFASGMKRWGRTPADARRFAGQWLEGHRALWRDRTFLRAMLDRPLPASIWDAR